MKSFIYSIFLIAVLSSCRTLPPGELPPDGILAQEIHTPSNMKKDKTAKEAVDFMLTAIVSGCPPVSSASTANPPRVINNFVASTFGSINYMPLEIWTNLTKMKLIEPVTISEDAKYLLHSEFILPSEDSDSKEVHWKLQFIENGTDIVIWNAQVNFIP